MSDVTYGVNGGGATTDKVDGFFGPDGAGAATVGW